MFARIAHRENQRRRNPATPAPEKCTNGAERSGKKFFILDVSLPKKKEKGIHLA